MPLEPVWLINLAPKDLPRHETGFAGLFSGIQSESVFSPFFVFSVRP